MISRRGQITIFIIIGIILVAAVAGFFILKDQLFEPRIPKSIQPIYTDFLSYLEDDVLSGINVLESQAGYIYVPDFEPGSSHMPFSSQLEFLGNPIPYWYYVSENNIQKEQVPSKHEMEQQLAQFIEDKAKDNKFEEHYENGFEINYGEPKATVKIKGKEVDVRLFMDLEITREEDSVKVKEHSVNVKSKLGELYDSARKVYDYEQDKLFLEEYAVDILNLYAPVTGVEISCSPKVWVADDVFDDLQEAIEANTLALATKGNAIDEYYEIDVSVDEDVRFINSRNWAHSLEVANDGNVLIANPVGNQPGLGILGFCYVPYHFVYDLKYPVLVQVSDSDEIFQFPVAVVVQANKAREPLEGASAFDIELPTLCKYKNTPVTVNVENVYGNSVDADVSFECFGTKCNLGRTELGVFKGEVPQCVNGYVLAKSDGYVDGKRLISTISGGSATIMLNKLHGLNVDLDIDGVSYEGEAMISFISDDVSETIVYPEQKTVKLAEGQYDVSVYIYEDSKLKLRATETEQCVKVPSSGIKGVLGFTTEKCFDVDIPEQIISRVLAGGGNQEHYFLDSELASSGTIEINAESLDVPKSLEELQESYILFESNGLDINLR